jgi:hypothetical protein
MPTYQSAAHPSISRANNPPSRLEANLNKYPMFQDRAKDLAADATALVHWMKDAAPSAERDALRASYTKTLQSIYIMAAVVAATAMIASFWVQHYDLDQQHDTDHGLDEGDDAASSVNLYKDKEMCLEGRDSTSTSIKRKTSVRSSPRSERSAVTNVQHPCYDKEMGVVGVQARDFDDTSIKRKKSVRREAYGISGGGGDGGGVTVGLPISERSPVSVQHLYHDKEMWAEARDESGMKRKKSVRREAYLS